VHVEWKKERGFTLRVEVPRKARVRLPGPGWGSVETTSGDGGTPCALDTQVLAQGDTVFLLPGAGVFVFRCM
jgi:hypothetical protein